MDKAAGVKEKEASLLLIEDNKEDVYATRRAFGKVGMSVPLIHMDSAEAAIRYLNRVYEEDGNKTNRTMIILDLNLPGMDGKELLRMLKSDDRFNYIPVVVLTTSLDKNDVISCYDAGASSYIHKPVNKAEFIEIIRSIKAYWFEVVVFPGEAEYERYSSSDS